MKIPAVVYIDLSGKFDKLWIMLESLSNFSKICPEQSSVKIPAVFYTYLSGKFDKL